MVDNILLKQIVDSPSNIAMIPFIVEIKVLLGSIAIREDKQNNSKCIHNASCLPAAHPLHVLCKTEKGSQSYSEYPIF
jgi:hypothetical protein